MNSSHRSHVSRWFWSFLIKPQVIYWSWYMILAYIFYRLDRNNPAWWQKRALGPRTVPLMFSPPVSQVVKNLISNGILASILGGLLLLTAPLHQNPDIVYWETSWKQRIGKIGFSTGLGALLFYWLHRAFHHPFLYRFHQQHHEVVLPYALETNYAHPVEMIGINIPSVFMGPILTKMSSNLTCLWLILAGTYTQIEHCGHRVISFIPTIMIAIIGSGRGIMVSLRKWIGYSAPCFRLMKHKHELMFRFRIVLP